MMFYHISIYATGGRLSDQSGIRTSQIGSIRCQQNFITSVSGCLEGVWVTGAGYEHDESDWIEVELGLPRRASSA